ncbi:MAG: hypothetical protein IT427_14975 [Pirellulales bacterium]|nr:hypothetical protein [Pirellulales bacterium]
MPLAHAGSTVVDTDYDGAVVTFNVANTYGGPTEIRRGTLSINHVDALGSGNAPLEMLGGALELHEVPQREIHVGDASMTNFRSDQPLNRDVRIKWGTIRGTGVYNGSIHLDAGIGGASLLGGTFNGVISGDNPVVFSLVNLNAENTFTNIAKINGPVFANTPQALGSALRGTVVVGNGLLTINAATAEHIHVGSGGRVVLNTAVARLPQFVGPTQNPGYGEQHVEIHTPSSYHQFYDVNHGYLEIMEDSTIDSLVVRQKGTIVVAPNRSLQTNAPLELQQGEINGRITGASAIRKSTGQLGALTNLGDYPGRIDIEKGVLQVDSDSSLGAPSGGTYVNGSRDAVLKAIGELTIHDDVYLNNATGIEHTGGLFIQESATVSQVVQINGRLDLGTVGSVLGGSDDSSSSYVELHLVGPVTGGSLTTRGMNNRVSILGGENTYAGVTDVREGWLTLTDGGRLLTTSAIRVRSDESYQEGRLFLDNRATNLPDRIGDDIPIQLMGGVLAFSPNATVASSESLGTVSFLEGDSTLNFYTNETPYQISPLHRIDINHLDRQRGAAASVGLGHSAQIHVTTPPQLVGGLLPWMVVEGRTLSGNRITNFATITDQGLAPIVSSTNNLNTAKPTDNVRISTMTSTFLASDKTINSISFEAQAKLDLANHSLTVESGGMLNGVVENGNVTAGKLGGYELILHGGYISANIVDNDTNPVTVTIARGGLVYLAGDNSYDGGTYVASEGLILQSATALPLDGDLQVVGGEVEINYSSKLPRHLGNVRIAGGGSIARSGGGGAILSFDQLVLEDGSFSPGLIVGNGSIIKRTVGEGEIQGSGMSESIIYNGEVVVEEGQLTVKGLDNAKFQTAGGTLVLPQEAPNHITLTGGALEFERITGTVEVTQPTRLIAYPYDSNNPKGFLASLRGSGDLIFDNRMTNSGSPLRIAMQNHGGNYTGNVFIQSATVDMVFDDSLGNGNITIEAGGNLLPRPLNLTNPLTLAGGAIVGINSFAQAQRIMGSVSVSGNSYLSGVDVHGPMRLAGESRLTIASAGPTRLFGDLTLDGTVEISVGNPEPDYLQHAGLVDLQSRIVAGATHSVLNIENGYIGEFLFNPSAHVPNGHSLRINVNQELAPLAFGNGKSLTGQGLIENPVQLLDNAAVSPGQSPGQLNFADRLIFGPGSIYEWELGNPFGVAGIADGWDLLSISGELLFDATPSAPMKLRIASWPKTLLPVGEGNRWLIASADTITGFDAAATSIELGPSIESADPLLLQHLNFVVDGGNLFLAYQVPEPASAISILWSAVGAVAVARRFRARRATIARSTHP